MVTQEWVRDTVRDFGRSLGVTRFHVNDRGVAAAHIQRVGSLFIEPRGDIVLIYMARDYGPLTVRELERALELTHPSEGRSMDVRVGLKGDTQFVFCVRVPVEDFRLETLETAVGLLQEMLDRVRER